MPNVLDRRSRCPQGSVPVTMIVQISRIRLVVDQSQADYPAVQVWRVGARLSRLLQAVGLHSSSGYDRAAVP
jgi:hypothetical protein